MPSFDVLVDSDVFVGWLYPQDGHFPQAQQWFAAFEKHQLHIVTSSMVVDETATVLSHRQGQALARQFLQVIQAAHLPLIHIDPTLRQQAVRLFQAQERRGTSMTDCANVILMRQFGIPCISSFDTVYGQDFHLAYFHL